MIIICFLIFTAVCGDGHTVPLKEECDDQIPPPHTSGNLFGI
jgi:hypothetical protein